MPQALADLKVLDLSRVLAMPYCSMMLGEHTEEVLRDVLGYDKETIARLKVGKVI